MKVTRPELILPGLLFCAGVMLALFSRFALLARLRECLPETRSDLATVYPYLEIQYLRNRSRVRSLGLDLLTVCTFLSPWLVLLMGIEFF